MGMESSERALMPNKAPVCSICIANYNGENMLVDCIESLLAQDCVFAFEIIVHDDASSDNSVALLGERYPQIKVLRSTDNVGFCISNNRMVEHAAGEYILLLNNDAALAPNALDSLLKEAHRLQSPAILSLPQYDWTTGDLVDRGCLLDLFYNPVPNLDMDRNDVAYVIGACLWCPRALWEDLGGLPEWMGSIGEDMFLCCVARLRGLPVRTISQSSYRHRQGASFGGNQLQRGKLHTTYRRRYLSERNKTSTLFICTPGSIAWFLMSAHLVLLLLEGIMLAIISRNSALMRRIYLRSISDFLKSLRVMRERRRMQQARRSIGLLTYLKPFTSTLRKLQMLVRYGFPKID